MPQIHPTAVLDPRARLADDVVVGPYVIIEGPVTIGAGTRVLPHTVIHGPTEIGARCKIGPAAYVGLDPQHAGYDGVSETWLVVGDDVTIRENVSIHRAMKPGRENATTIGNRCYLMATSHVGHDAKVGEQVTLANGTMLGGHSEVGARAFLGGGSGLHQFVRVGRIAIIRGNEPVTHDVPPFAAMAYGGLKGYNAVGCKRAGISPAGIASIRRAYHCIHQNRSLPTAVAQIRDTVPETPEVLELLDFIANSRRGLPASVRFFRSGAFAPVAPEEAAADGQGLLQGQAAAATRWRE
jgi:UDP-N-acetylglucosamine acyltransferase